MSVRRRSQIKNADATPPLSPLRPPLPSCLDGTAAKADQLSKCLTSSSSTIKESLTFRRICRTSRLRLSFSKSSSQKHVLISPLPPAAFFNTAFRSILTSTLTSSTFTASILPDSQGSNASFISLARVEVTRPLTVAFAHPHNNRHRVRSHGFN